MRWNDVEQLAHALEDNYPHDEVNNLKLNKLHKKIVQLLDFDDDPQLGSERVLEAIQEALVRTKR